jgi:hypothetical protein
MMTVTNTTNVESTNSERVGQADFFSSTTTSVQNSLILGMGFVMDLSRQHRAT